MIYLDHAATSFPKPEAVLAAVEHWFRAIGVSPARGDSALCAAAERLVRGARMAVADLCGVPVARVAFSSGATEATNALLRGLLQPADRVLTTAAEHSAVARTLRALRDEQQVETTVIPVDRHGRVDAGEIERELAARPYRLLAFAHASNVTGAVQDARTLCDLARAQGTLSFVDASQTAGARPLAELGADAITASAHKGLLAPPGLGFLATRETVPLRPTKQGGTGSSRALDEHPRDWPAGFEAGTPNMPAIAGLLAALQAHAPATSEAAAQRALAHLDALRAELQQRLDGRIAWQSPAAGPRIPILSFTVRDLDPAEAGVILDAAGIHVRTGFHCAPWIHRWLGTEVAGTIRVSPGPFVTEAEVLAVARTLAP